MKKPNAQLQRELDAAPMTCEFCDRPHRCPYRLIDRDGLVAGRYCAADCAQADAVGPRFRTATVELHGRVVRGLR